MLYEAYLAIVQFIELGGNVLYAIAFVTFVMWGLIFERVVFFTTEYRGMVRESVTSWEQRSERSSWGARQIRDGMISNAADKINGSFPVIQICVALCPLFGLLGTVTGMIAVFEAMATQGGNARSMAAALRLRRGSTAPLVITPSAPWRRAKSSTCSTTSPLRMVTGNSRQHS